MTGAKLTARASRVAKFLVWKLQQDPPPGITSVSDTGAVSAADPSCVVTETMAPPCRDRQFVLGHWVAGCRSHPTNACHGGSGMLRIGAPTNREPADRVPVRSHDAFDLVNRHRVHRAVVELRRLGRRMTRDLLRMLKVRAIDTP